MGNYLKTIGVLFFTIFIISSCSTTKRPVKTVKKPDKTQVNNLEKKLGFSISKNDPNYALYQEAAQWIGVPYRYGGTTKKGVDCSGITMQIYKTVYKKNLHRSSADMAKHDVRSISKSSLRPGDLIFFATSSNKKKVTHVGIFLKNNRFIHASSKAGVVVNDLNEVYYKKAYLKAGRVK